MSSQFNVQQSGKESYKNKHRINKLNNNNNILNKIKQAFIAL